MRLGFWKHSLVSLIYLEISTSLNSFVLILVKVVIFFPADLIETLKNVSINHCRLLHGYFSNSKRSKVSVFSRNISLDLKSGLRQFFVVEKVDLILQVLHDFPLVFYNVRCSLKAVPLVHPWFVFSLFWLRQVKIIRNSIRDFTNSTINIHFPVYLPCFSGFPLKPPFLVMI